MISFHLPNLTVSRRIFYSQKTKMNYLSILLIVKNFKEMTVIITITLIIRTTTILPSIILKNYHY